MNFFWNRQVVHDHMTRIPSAIKFASYHSNSKIFFTISSANLSITGRPNLFHCEYFSFLELAIMTVWPMGKWILSPTWVDCAKSCDVRMIQSSPIVSTYVDGDDDDIVVAPSSAFRFDDTDTIFSTLVDGPWKPIRFRIRSSKESHRGRNHDGLANPGMGIRSRTSMKTFVDHAIQTTIWEDLVIVIVAILLHSATYLCPTKCVQWLRHSK